MTDKKNPNSPIVKKLEAGMIHGLVAEPAVDVESADEPTVAVTEEQFAMIEKVVAEMEGRTITEIDLTKGEEVDWDNVNWLELTKVKIPVVPILPMRGDLETEFTGTVAGHRYAASPFLNYEKFMPLIEDLFVGTGCESLVAVQGEKVLKKAGEEVMEVRTILHQLGQASNMTIEGNVVAGGVVVESPGGSPTESHALAEKLRREAKKKKVPLLTFSQNIAASGGYFLGCAGDEFYAAEMADIGSIGVVTHNTKLSWLGRLLSGVNFRFITAGKKKRNNFHNPHVKHTKEEEQEVVDGLTEIHGVFMDYVRKCRGDRIKAPADVVFSGECFTGRKALELGLIDGVGFYEDIIPEKFGEFVAMYEMAVTDDALMADNMGAMIAAAQQAGLGSEKAAKASATRRFSLRHDAAGIQMKFVR